MKVTISVRQEDGSLKTLAKENVWGLKEAGCFIDEGFCESPGYLEWDEKSTLIVTIEP